LYTAVVHIGISPDEFWGLSWYEYDLYVLRLDALRERETFKWETGWDQTRILWSTAHNAAFKNKVKPVDLIKLSFDKPKQKKEDKPLTPQEMKEMFGGKFKK
jgi:hypothetical protein